MQRVHSIPNRSLLKLCLESLLLALYTHRILGVSTQEVASIVKLAIALLHHTLAFFAVPTERSSSTLTMHVKHLSCQSDPSALTTKSVTGFRHLRHLELYRFVWQPTHHAYPSFSTKGVELSKGSPHCAQKKCPACHSAPHATITSPSMGVLQLLHRGEKSS